MNLTALPDGRAARYPQTVAYADRRNGELTNTQRPQRVQAVTDRVPNGACASRGSVAQLRPAYARQGNSTSLVPMNRPAVNAGPSAAAPAVDADQRQAQYFLRLLVQSCLRIEQQIDRYQKAIVMAEASGAVDHGRRLRRAMRVEQQERHTLTKLIDRLRRRFPPFPLG
jgi:hypothetical protein